MSEIQPPTEPPHIDNLAELTLLDPTHDVLRHRRRSLQSIFKPETVAVIGASEQPNSVGRTLLWNLISSPFGGTVFPVNRKRKSVLGIKAYPDLASVPAQVDLAVIATPAPSVPGIMRECVEAGVKGAIIISAGFKERGPKGIELEKQVLAEARRGRIRIVGPNCLGVMHPPSGLNATFASTIARPGSVGFISQSGALCTSILDWSISEVVGFSAFISIGSMLDVGWGDLIYYLGDDPDTHSIVIYMESIGDARSFMSAAREVALHKPIIVIKAGRTEAAAQAASSHTGSMTGSDEVLDAAFRRCGVLRVDRISDLFNMAEVLSKQPPSKGPRLTIVTNAGGPGVLATDALLTSGGKLATLEPKTKTALDEVLPKHWSQQNPIDIIGDAAPKRYSDTFEVLKQDKETDGMLVILSPQAMTHPTDTAKQMASTIGDYNKPILASWMGGASVDEGEHLLNEAGIPTFRYPDTAARMFGYMWKHTYSLEALYETPNLSIAPGEQLPDVAAGNAIVSKAWQSNRLVLTELESKQLLETYSIPTVPTYFAADADTAAKMAEKAGFPVVVKLHSYTITHKTDVGGVQLNLKTPENVRDAFLGMQKRIAELEGPEHFQGVTVQPMVNINEGYELIIGSSTDPQFGPVMLFGAGGSLVEVMKDRSLGLPPLNTTLARRMIERTRIYKALQGVRGRDAVDIAALERLMVRFSQIVAEHREIKEIEINPLIASSNQLLVLDARVLLHESNTDLKTLPRLAIRPFPTQYVEPWKLEDGTEVIIRPIQPEDEPLIVNLHHELSEESVYYRYVQAFPIEQRTRHQRLSQICFIDYDREMALVVTKASDNPEGPPRILAVGRISRMVDSGDAEFSMVVVDDYQRHGVGTEVLRRLIEIARMEGVERITAETLPENHGMKRVFQKLGFTIKYVPEDGIVYAHLDL